MSGLADTGQVLPSFLTAVFTLSLALTVQVRGNHSERGVRLSRYCHGRLEEAERRIEVLGERGELQPAPPALDAAATEDGRPPENDRDEKGRRT